MASDPTLIPCPWPHEITEECHKPEAAYEEGGERVWCPMCGVMSPPFATRQKACAWWNRRAAPAGLTLAAALAEVEAVRVDVGYVTNPPRGYVAGWSACCDLFDARFREGREEDHPQPADGDVPADYSPVPTDHCSICRQPFTVKDALRWQDDGAFVHQDCGQPHLVEAAPDRRRPDSGMWQEQGPMPSIPPAEAERLAGAVERPAYTVTGDTTPPPDSGARELLERALASFDDDASTLHRAGESVVPIAQDIRAYLAGHPAPPVDGATRGLVQELADYLAIATDGGCCGLCGCASPDHAPDCLVGQLLAKARAYLAAAEGQGEAP